MKCRVSLSYRDLEEMLALEGAQLEHYTEIQISSLVMDFSIAVNIAIM